MRTKMENPVDEKEESMPDKEPDIMDDHEAQGHLDTIIRAHAIMSNPDKMKKVHALAGRHDKALAGIKSIKDLKQKYDDKYGSGALKKLGRKAVKDSM